MTEQQPTVIELNAVEASMAFGWSFDRDYPMLGEDEIALQDRLRAVVAPEWTGNTPDSSQNAAQEAPGAQTGTEGRATPGKGAETPVRMTKGSGRSVAVIHPDPALVDDPEVECKKCLWRFPISSVHECPARVIAENEMVVDRDEQYALMASIARVEALVKEWDLDSETALFMAAYERAGISRERAALIMSERSQMVGELRAAIKGEG